MKIKLTNFALRHFDPKFTGTKILNHTEKEFQNKIDDAFDGQTQLTSSIKNDSLGTMFIYDGYAPFCKLLAIPNFTDARVGSLPITLENYQYIRSGYSARTKDELPVFSRWLELPIDKPKADWLILVLYSKEQIDKEEQVEYKKKFHMWASTLTLRTYPLDKNKPLEPNFDGDYGIVAILGQSHPEEEPMKPETMIRNAGYNTKEYQEKALEKLKNIWENNDDLSDDDIKSILSLQGTIVGGSGVPFLREEYLKSVEFWDKNCTVK